MKAMISGENMIQNYSHLFSDKRLSVWHFSIYMALTLLWYENELANPFSISRKSIMELAHVHSFATYHKCIKQLELFGYIQYNPSYSYYERSSIFINDVDKLSLVYKHNE
ncbi:MAG: hypothetical protein ABJA37_13735 [Ferruginibacter sp.]